LLEILNEKIGLYRRTLEKDKAYAAIEEAFTLIDTNEIADRASIGTIYVNGATTMKAFGRIEEAIHYYKKAEEIYESLISENDYRYAALYNNMSSAYKDIGDFLKCEALCYKALDILKKSDRYNGEIAVTLINLSHLYHDNDPFDERIYSLMDDAWKRLTSDDNVHDGNFAFFCSKCYPSFGFFGYFEREAELKALMEKIYAGN
jgi:tetratricopeptide (TPR) repeat protein